MFSFPNVAIPIAFIKDYKVEREKGLKSYLGFLANSVNNVFETRKPVYDDLITLLETTGANFPPLPLMDTEGDNDKIEQQNAMLEKVINDCINVILKLGDLGRTAQDERMLHKYIDILPNVANNLFEHKDSYFCQACHAARTFFIHQIKSNERLKPIYESKISQRKKSYFDNYEEIRKLESKGNNVAEAKKNNFRELVWLADLGEMDCLLEALDKKLINNFAKLTQPERELFKVYGINPNYPTCYQFRYYRIHHELQIRPHTRNDFTGFIIEANKESKKFKQTDTQIDEFLLSEQLNNPNMNTDTSSDLLDFDKGMQDTDLDMQSSQEETIIESTETDTPTIQPSDMPEPVFSHDSDALRQAKTGNGSGFLQHNLFSNPEPKNNATVKKDNSPKPWN